MRVSWRREGCGQNEDPPEENKGRRGRMGMLLCALLAFAVLVWSGIRIRCSLAPTERTVVEIVQNNQVLYRIDLRTAPDQTIRIDSDGAGSEAFYNEIRIEDGTIRVSSADCPDQTCVRMGVLRSEELPIICLPHRLVIRFAETEVP